MCRVTAEEMVERISNHFDDPKNRKSVIRDCVFYQIITLYRRTGGTLAFFMEDAPRKKEAEKHIQNALKGEPLTVEYKGFYPADDEPQMEAQVRVRDSYLLGEFLCTLTEEDKIVFSPQIAYEARTLYDSFVERFEKEENYSIEF